MMTVNLDRAAVLLDVMQKVANVGPMFTAIAGRAGDELKTMNDEILEENKKKAAAEKAKAAEEAAKAEVELRHDREPAPRIFPKDSGVQEETDTPVVQRRVPT